MNKKQWIVIGCGWLVGLAALITTRMIGCSQHIGNVPMPHYERTASEAQAFTQPSFYNFLPNQDTTLTGVTLSGYFCGAVGLSMSGNTSDQHNVNTVSVGGAQTWHGHTSGTATMELECLPCSDFHGIASCGSPSAAGFQTENNGMTGAPIALEGSHIWQPGHFLVVNQGIGGGGSSGTDIFGLTPPLQGFAVSAQTAATVTGNAFGVQFLDSSSHAVSPKFDVTLFYFQTLGGALVDLGEDDAGMCWLGSDLGNTVVDIYVNTATPPHKILDATRVGNNFVTNAWCLAYSF